MVGISAVNRYDIFLTIIAVEWKMLYTLFVGLSNFNIVLKEETL